MRSRNQRSCEITSTLPANSEQRILERAQRLDVEVVRRLVEQQHVAALQQRRGEMQPAALAAGKLADVLLLVAALEVEAAEVGARRHLELADGEDVLAAGDRLPRGLVVGQRFARLVDDGELRRMADDDRRRCPASRLPVIIRNSVVLPAPLGPMMPTIAPGGTLNDRSSISSRSP